MSTFTGEDYTNAPKDAPIRIELLGTPDDPKCAVWIDDGVVPFIKSRALREALLDAFAQELQRRAGN